MAKSGIDGLIREAMTAVVQARGSVKSGEAVNLTQAASIVDRCHKSCMEDRDALSEKQQSRLVGLLDEVEQLTADIHANHEVLRDQMHSLNQATSAQRAYRGNGSR